MFKEIKENLDNLNKIRRIIHDMAEKLSKK